MEGNKREFKGVWIPAEVWLAKDLTIIQKVIYAEIDSFCKNGRSCYFSNEYLAKFCNISIPTVKRTISDMKKKGYIVQSGFDGRKRYLQVIQRQAENETDQNDTSDVLKCDGQGNHFDPLYINTYTNPSTNNVSKDTYRETENTVSLNKNFKTSLFIEGWNKLPLVRKHNSPATKEYQKAVHLLQYLLHGSFGSHCSLDQGFLDNNRIPLHFECKKFTHEDLHEGIRRLSLLYQEGYWPEDKKTIKKMSLASLIYNPRSKGSFLLKVMATEPKPIIHLTSLSPVIADKYRKILKEKNRTVQDDQEIILQTNLFCRKYEALSPVLTLLFVINSGSKSYLGSVEKFADIHIRWLQDYYKEHIRIPAIMSSWKKFMDYVQDFYEYDLLPTAEKMKKMNAEYEDVLSRREKRNSCKKQSFVPVHAQEF